MDLAPPPLQHLPMMARKRPMPIPIARSRSIGIASRIALRKPVDVLDRPEDGWVQ
jgi:hypothetical protein